MVNCSGMCLFATFAVNLKQITPFLHAATGLDVHLSSEEVMKIGERVNNLVRLFNMREGLTRNMDTLPRRFFSEPLTEGPSRNRVVELDRLLDEYYLVRGWDVDGAPREEKLKELGLEKL